MENIKVLIADDSVIYRSQIRAALAKIPQIEVIGAASNGKRALEYLRQYSVDLLILDLEMPELDGLQTLSAISEEKLSCKVLVFSSASKKGAEITLEALKRGASDFALKPGTSHHASPFEIGGDPSDKILSMLEPKIAALLTTKAPATVPPSAYPHVIWDLFDPKILVIGSSTGGPTVLEKIFSQLKSPLKCPVLITQHMPPLFTAALAERLQKLSGVQAVEATHGTKIEANHIYVAPGNYHMSLVGTKSNCSIVLDQDPLIHSVRPAVDPLFSSAAAIFKENCLGVVLTGMGRDGKDGAEAIKSQGGAVLIQDEASCIVFGMPGAVMAAGAFDQALNPDQMSERLIEKLTHMGLSQNSKRECS